MGINGMWWRFEPEPPALQQIAAHLEVRCGLPVRVDSQEPSGGHLTVRVLESPIEITIEGDKVEVLILTGSPLFVWAHVEATLIALGGKRDSMGGQVSTLLPVWTARPWSELGAWRRFAVQYPGAVRLPLVILVAPLVIPVGLLWVLLLPVIDLGRALRRWFGSPGPGDR